MQSLSEYIAKSFNDIKVTNSTSVGNFENIIIKEVKLDKGKHCADLSKDEFAKLFIDSITDAIDNYTKFKEKELEKSLDLRIKYVEEEARAKAEKLWKRESKRQQYIDTVINKEKERKFNHQQVKEAWVKIGVGTSNTNHAVININNPKRDVDRVYDDMTNDEYIKSFFEDASGWVIYSEERIDKTIYSYGEMNRLIYINFIYSDKKLKEIEKNEGNFAKEMTSFYKNSVYFGD